VSKRIGDVVMGGTVNQSGCFYMKATRVGSSTSLAQIIRLVEDAQTSKAPIQAFADRVAAVFVPAVLLIASLTFLVWFSLGVSGSLPEGMIPEGQGPFLYALLYLISVTAISCPCALVGELCGCVWWETSTIATCMCMCMCVFVVARV
jgi:P-type Cu+ transporter